MAKAHFQTLDAMRGVAAVAVLIYHFRRLISPEHGKTFGFASGYLAVDLFFVLSGFVIALAYDPKLQAGMRFRDFLKVRAIRLLPMIWLGVALGCAVMLFFGGSVARVGIQGALNAFIIPRPPMLGDLMFPTNTPVWSLFFEVVANLGFAALFGWLGLKTLKVAVPLAGVALIFLAFRHGGLEDGYQFSGAHVGLARVVFSFFLGVILCRTRALWLGRLPKLPAWAVLTLAAVALWVPVEGVARIAYDLAFILILSPLIVIAGACVEPSARGQKLAVQLGLLSYPLYAVHIPFREAIQLGGEKYGFDTTAPALVTIAALVPLSLALFYVYDQPVRAHLTRLTAADGWFGQLRLRHRKEAN